MEFIIGMIVGGILYYAFAERKKPVGTFVMDFTDPMKDICRLELDKDLNEIYSKKRIYLRVKIYKDDSLK